MEKNDELKKLTLRITELENQLKKEGVMGQEIDPEEMKVFQKVWGQINRGAIVGCINECKPCIVQCISQCISVCKVCKVCTVCQVCKVCTVCQVCKVCKVCKVCINECSCGPCIASGLSNFEAIDEFDDLGM